MRIAIDARMMGADVTRGIGRYIQELILAMLELHSDNTFVLITRTKDHAFTSYKNVETIVADIPWYGMQEQMQMPNIFRKALADVIHIPHWNIPLFIRGKVAITIHDVLLRHYPASAKSSTRNFFLRTLKSAGYRIILAYAIRRAHAIFVPSHFVAKDLAEFYPAAKKKIIVTGEGMPSPVYKTCTVENFASPYLLYVGSAYPHKGLGSLLIAWNKIRIQYPALRLKIVGEKDIFMMSLEGSQESGDMRIDFVGRIGDKALSRLYAHATAFVFPSLHEGFGLPPLEALAHGTPVIASDAGSLPEVIGPDNAFFFHAGDPDAILTAVDRVLSDPERAHAMVLIASKDCMRRHSWKATAEATIQGYFS